MFFKIFFIIFFGLISVAFFVLFERKVLSLIGVRLGPNKVSFLGIFQSLSDALKLMNKNQNLLFNSSLLLYFLSPFLFFFSSVFIYSCFFSFPSVSSFKFPLLMIFLIMSFNVFNSMICGWSIFGKYSLLGVLRNVAQLISYELVLYLCIFFLILFYDSFNFLDFNFFKFGSLFFFDPFLMFFWLPCFLAELSRTPFDFSEGESELVAGFMTDYGSFGFTMIFLAEYGMIIFLSFLTSFFFFSFFLFFFYILIFFSVWSRAVLPRHRFDKLMFLCWKFYIPSSVFFFLIFIFFIF